jgi:hypothetical protein
MAKAPKNWIDEDEDEPKKAPPPAPKALEPDAREVPPQETIPLEPSSGGDGELPSQLVPYPTQADLVEEAPAKAKLKGK